MQIFSKLNSESCDYTYTFRIVGNILAPAFYDADYVMIGHVITTRSVGSRMECTFECLKNPQCVSVNYEEIGKPLHTCELCNRSRNHHPLKLLAKNGWTYTDNNQVI